jgi:hypothetical protein
MKMGMRVRVTRAMIWTKYKTIWRTNLRKILSEESHPPAEARALTVLARGALTAIGAQHRSETRIRIEEFNMAMVESTRAKAMIKELKETIPSIRLIDLEAFVLGTKEVDHHLPFRKEKCTLLPMPTAILEEAAIMDRFDRHTMLQRLVEKLQSKRRRKIMNMLDLPTHHRLLKKSIA